MPRAGDEIVNPRTGQRMIFRQTASETAGDLLQIECFSPPSTAREPEHIHPYQENRFELLSGTLRFRVQGREQTVGPGEVITIPPGTPHRFWNDSDEEARYIQEFRPAMEIGAFFERLFGLARDGKLTDKGAPGIMQMAVSGPAFWNEIRVSQPPEIVQKIVFALLEPIGRLLGYRP